jgi:hypothetical protein
VCVCVVCGVCVCVRVCVCGELFGMRPQIVLTMWMCTIKIRYKLKLLNMFEI